MNALTQVLVATIDAVWDACQSGEITAVEASRQVNELLGNPSVDPAEIARLRTVHAALRGISRDEDARLDL
jgi:hypothetical protein